MKKFLIYPVLFILALASSANAQYEVILDNFDSSARDSVYVLYSEGVPSRVIQTDNSTDFTEGTGALDADVVIGAFHPWGSYCNLSNDFDTQMDLTVSDSLSIWIKVRRAPTHPEYMVFRINLKDQPTPEDPIEWYHYENAWVLDTQSGWVQLRVPLLERETDGTVLPNEDGFVLFPLTWGGGTYNNSVLDRDAIVGYGVEMVTYGWTYPELIPADSLVVSFDELALFGLRDTTPPAAPENLSVSPEEYSNLIVWDDVSGEAGEVYNVYFSKNPIFDLESEGLEVVALKIPENTESVTHLLTAPVTDQQVAYYYAILCKDVSSNVSDMTSTPGAVTNMAKGIVTISLNPPAGLVCDGDLSEWTGIDPIRIFPSEGVLYAPDYPVDDDDDLSCSAYLAVDGDYLYIAFDVTDDMVEYDEPTNVWENDRIDMFLGLYDQRGFKHTNYKRGEEPDYQIDFQFQNVFLESPYLGAIYTPDSTWYYIAEKLPSGYTVECRLPWILLAGGSDEVFDPVEGMRIPIDFSIQDRDGGARQGILTWSRENQDRSSFSPVYWTHTWIGSLWEPIWEPIVDSVSVTFTANTAMVPDTLGPASTVQVRGSVAPLTWGGDSPVFLHNVGGDYWKGTVDLPARSVVQYKYFTNSHDTVYNGAQWENQGWEDDIGPYVNRYLTVGSLDTTLAIEFVNGWQRDIEQYAKRWTDEEGSFVVWVRVNVQGWGDFDPDNQIIGIRGSNTVDGGQTGEISWDCTYPLTREWNHTNGGSQQYPGGFFYSGAVHVPDQYAGNAIEFKVVVHHAGADLCESWDNMAYASILQNHVDISGNDTTNYWFWFDNMKPEGSQQHIRTVFNANDSGPGSLREAILFANANAGINTIRFNIPGDEPHSIQLTSNLPTINDTLVIDGYTQLGAQPNTDSLNGSLNSILMVELDGSNAGTGANGLEIAAGNCVVRGLVINRFNGHGIHLHSNGNNWIEGNYIGADTTGTSDFGNAMSGVYIDSSSQNNVIGPDNLLAFNGTDGVTIFGEQTKNSVVFGNILSNNIRDGIRMENVVDDSTQLTNNTIKRNLVGIHVINGIGLPTMEGNVIEDNTEAGVLIENGGSSLSKVIVAGGEVIQNNIVSKNKDGIHVTSQSLQTLTVSHNNIFENTGYGIINESPTLTIYANDNWWGADSGPYNEDTNPEGQGNAIAGNVDCTEWLPDVLVLSVSSQGDASGAAASVASVSFKVYNLGTVNSTFNMTVTDSLGWGLSPDHFALSLGSKGKATATISVTIPEEAELGTINKISLSGVADQDPSVTGSDVAFITVMEGVRGDLNKDRAINILDALRTVNIILGISDPPTEFENWAADCNDDGNVNVLDVLGIVNVILGIGECEP